MSHDPTTTVAAPAAVPADLRLDAGAATSLTSPPGVSEAVAHRVLLVERFPGASASALDALAFGTGDDELLDRQRDVARRAHAAAQVARLGGTDEEQAAAEVYRSYYDHPSAVYVDTTTHRVFAVTWDDERTALIGSRTTDLPLAIVGHSTPAFEAGTPVTTRVLVTPGLDGCALITQHQVVGSGADECELRTSVRYEHGHPVLSIVQERAGSRTSSDLIEFDEGVRPQHRVYYATEPLANGMSRTLQETHRFDAEGRVERSARSERTDIEGASYWSSLTRELDGVSGVVQLETLLEIANEGDVLAAERHTTTYRDGSPASGRIRRELTHHEGTMLVQCDEVQCEPDGTVAHVRSDYAPSESGALNRALDATRASAPRLVEFSFGEIEVRPDADAGRRALITMPGISIARDAGLGAAASVNPN